MKRIPRGNSMLRLRNSSQSVDPTPERARHLELVERDVIGKGKSWTNPAQRWLDRYKIKGILAPKNHKLNEILYDAGERYLRLATAAYRSACQSTLGNLQPRSDQARDGSGSIDAKVRLARVNRAVGNPHAECLMAVVFSDESATDWIRTLYRSRGWLEPDRRIGLDRLRDALWHAAKHWGML